MHVELVLCTRTSIVLVLVLVYSIPLGDSVEKLGTLLHYVRWYTSSLYT